jgi:hypothetical protein
LVVVDDIDRLHADELLSVMEAVGRFDEKTVLDVLEFRVLSFLFDGVVEGVRC